MKKIKTPRIELKRDNRCTNCKKYVDKNNFVFYKNICECKQCFKKRYKQFVPLERTL